MPSLPERSRATRSAISALLLQQHSSITLRMRSGSECEVSARRSASDNRRLVDDSRGFDGLFMAPRLRVLHIYSSTT